MAISIGIQQPPLPLYVISPPVALNYLNTPHATSRGGAWGSPSSTLTDPDIVETEGEPFARFTRSAVGPAVISINDSSLDIPSGTFDVRLWVRTSAAEPGATLGLRLGQSQSSGDNKVGSAFTPSVAGWQERIATVTISASDVWTLVLRLAGGTVGTRVDVKLGAIMANGQPPFYGDTRPAVGTDDFYYWEGAANASKSARSTRTMRNTPGPSYSVDNLTTYSISESVSPLSPVDTSGAATTVQLGIQEFEDSALLDGGELTIFEDGYPVVQGEIVSPSSDGSVVSITSMSALARLNTVKRVAPFVGSLDGYIAMLLASVGSTRPLNVDLGIAERPVAIHGFKDNILSKVKEFCSVQGVELSDRGDAVYIREPRTRLLNVENLTQTSRSTDSSQMAQSIEIINYNSAYKVDSLVYPESTYDDTSGQTTAPGWNKDVSILTVDAGGVTTLEVPILGSLMSLEQPTCVKEVGPNDGFNGSVYTVIGQGTGDGSAVAVETLDPAVWTAKGGSVSVAVGQNFDTIIITIRAGANEPVLAPFAIAMSSGDGTFYSSLRIRATGIFDRKEKLSYPTGLGPDDSSIEIGATVDSFYVQDRGLADHVASETLPLYSRPITAVTADLAHSNLVTGDIAGSRFRLGDSFYRVTQSSSSESGITVSASADTTMDDFDAIWSDLTFDDFDTQWAIKSDLQFAAAPLLIT